MEPKYISTATVNLQGFRFQQNNTIANYGTSTRERNWAFLDMQNLYKEVSKRNWKINWKIFRQYLEKKYNVTKAIGFLGYMKENEHVYQFLKRAGFILEFRMVNRLKNGEVKGNVDVDLVAYALNNINDYNKAIIIADDCDYCGIINNLKMQNKLSLIISSHSKNKTSNLIKRIASEFILSIDSIRHIIEYKK